MFYYASGRCFRLPLAGCFKFAQSAGACRTKHRAGLAYDLHGIFAAPQALATAQACAARWQASHPGRLRNDSRRLSAATAPCHIAQGGIA
jgi:hypothetical protein